MVFDGADLSRVRVPPVQRGGRDDPSRNHDYQADDEGHSRHRVVKELRVDHGSQSPFASMRGPSWPCTIEIRGKASAPASDKRRIVRLDPPYAAVLARRRP
jgi:hypothetical protein